MRTIFRRPGGDFERLVALAAAELLEGGSALPAAPAAAPEPAGRGDAPALEPETRLFALASGAFGASAPARFGGALLLERRLRGRFRGALSATAETGGRALDLGRVQVLALSGAVAVGPRWDLGPLRLALEGGARLGAVHFRGTSDLAAVDARSFWAPWGGPFAATWAEFAVGRRLCLRASFEVGYALASAVALAAQERAAAVEGLWTGASLGLGMRLD